MVKRRIRFGLLRGRVHVGEKFDAPMSIEQFIRVDVNAPSALRTGDGVNGTLSEQRHDSHDTPPQPSWDEGQGER